MKKPNSLYIHIPFCHKICSFCDFTKVMYIDRFIKPYIDSLINEIDSYQLNSLYTVYIGGGSPSVLSCAEIEPLLKIVSPLLDKKYEFTIECNPEDLSDEKIKLYKKYGVNRISLGVQSFNCKVLESVNRFHSFSSIKNIINIIKKNGINNISIDLIYGLPNQDLVDLKEDVASLLALPITHFSAYSLSINEGTVLYNKGIREIPEDLSRTYYDLILSEARKRGFERYEVSNFAKNKNYSKHNLVYWNDEEYIGVGLGSSGYINGIRYQNTKNLEKYISNGPSKNEIVLTNNDIVEEYIMLKLRTMWGFSLDDFKMRFPNYYSNIIDVINSFVNDKLLIINDNFVCCSDDGLMILDHILLKLFNAMEV